jgi:ankyrin repeat protein
MCAAAWGHLESAKVLIQHGADVGLVDNRGGTAFDIALEKGEDEMAEFLRKVTIA